jgi:mannan endo-1,4-beta-mannosidase
LTGTKVADGFYTDGGRLYDAYGNEFVIRGLNNAHVWFDGYAEYLAYDALDEIAGHGVNTVRMVWEANGSTQLLAEILYRIVELEMVPIIEMHEPTGGREAELLIDAAEYYAQEDVAQVLQDFREYLLVNIANEWSGSDDVFLSTYQQAIDIIRGAGIDHTLVIDANGWGQSAQAIFDHADALTDHDQQHNLLFSVHMYAEYPTAASVRSVLDQAASDGIPLIVGEFGTELGGTAVAWEQILASCVQNGQGYLAWSWYGNDSATEHLNMAEDWEGALTAWGESVINGPDGIAETAQPASIFE